MTMVDLDFLNTVIRFEISPDAEPAFEPIRRFFRHLLVPLSDRSATFTIKVDAYEPEADVDQRIWDTEQSVIRRSSAAEFNFDAHVVEEGERRRYVNRTTVVDVPKDARSDGLFRLRITAGSAIQVIDFVRDLIIRNEEDLGTVVLHASGLVRGGEALIIAGAKGAGKTTTMLSALRRPGWSYFTGDKVFCRRVGETIEVYPWRDYPYVGVGTIRADARLERLVREQVDPGIDERAATDKLLIDPDLFESWLGVEFSAQPRRLAAILLPEVRPGEPLTTWQLRSEAERWAHLNKIVDRQVDTTFFTWQSHLVPDYSAFYRSLADLREVLPSVAMVRLRGTLDVDPDRVLRGGVLRVAVIGLAGSGKSTTASLLEEAATAAGLSHARVKLAKPLYDLQDSVYVAAGRAVGAGAQDQVLMEDLADNLRRINPRALVDDFTVRLNTVDADVIVNDDLRDPQVDAVALRALGFRVVRVRCDEDLRQKRLAERRDPTRADRSTRRLEEIEADLELDNSGDLDGHRAAVRDLLEGWL
ncbi:AAA family ATPase [Nonomuraea longicatena]|uniref:AAA family ATPase n=1 Tax=Nonomuraea longicatena TaxID=83682 RepID=A0ABP4A523_9ACTN